MGRESGPCACSRKEREKSERESEDSIRAESEPYSSENVNKVLNDTEEGITMSTVPQCDEIPL